MNDSIKKSPYKGILITCFFLIAVPLGLFFLFKTAIFAYQKKFSDDINLYTSLFLGFGTGFLFQMCCVLCGLFRGSFKVVIKRVFGFFSNLSISFGFASKTYLDDLKEDGAVFWIILIIVASTFAVTIYGLLGFMECYNIL